MQPPAPQTDASSISFATAGAASAIAAAASMGDSKMPKNGYSTPAAIGTPAAL